MTEDEIRVECARLLGEDLSESWPRNYPGSLDACLEIVAAMRKEGFYLHLSQQRDDQWKATFIRIDNGKPHVDEICQMAATAPLAICKCYLKHKGQWKE